MYKELQAVCCVSFAKNTFFMIHYDPRLETVIASQTVNCDFPVTDDLGAVAQPAHLANYIQDLFEREKLPKQVRIGINLQYLDLKRMTFPDMPDDELQQIVRDEAVRESIFSYSHEAVAVAFKMVGIAQTKTGLVNREILVATVPQTVIASLIATFKLTDLKLLSIQPNIEGLHQFFSAKVNTDLPVILVNVLSEQSEFYIWVNRQPRFWRYLSVGANAPDRLSSEVSRSIEHFQRRTVDDENIEFQKIYWLGVAVAGLKFNETFQVADLTAEPLPELTGLALSAPQNAELCFLNHPRGRTISLRLELQKWWPYGLVILGGLNLWMGWQLHQQQLRMEQARQAYRNLQHTQTNLAHQLDALESISHPASSAMSATFNLYYLMVGLRRIVPPDMQLEKLLFQPAGKSLTMEGFCLQADSLSRFLRNLQSLYGYHKLNLIDSHQENRGRLEVVVFHLEVELGANQ
jgi:hypothetical protein